VKKREDMDVILDSQLARLRTDRIDYYLLHGLDGALWERMLGLGVLEFLERAKRDGRIANTGFSFHGDRDSFKRIVDAYDWEMCQIQYNFLDEDFQAGTEGLEYAAARNLGVVIMEPLRGGKLTGRIPQEVEAVWAESETQRTPAEWALRWLWNRPEVTCVISGMNREEHIEENLRVAGEADAGTLTPAELDLTSRVAETYRRIMKVGCTGCAYCMPCPHGVNIPACFDIYNSKHAFGDPRARLTYAMIVGGGMRDLAAASLCRDCGKCAKKCPQHLPIPELLKDVAGEFETPLMKPMGWVVRNALAVMTWRSKRQSRISV
jgi:predicted aldo/keto reductase-like oxidoreductase